MAELLQIEGPARQRRAPPQWRAFLELGLHVPHRVMLRVEHAIGRRAVRIMPWVLLVLYGAGLSLAWQHRVALAMPLASSFGLLLSIKIALALSVLGHFFTAMWWRRHGRLHGQRSRRLHYSVFAHVLLIAVLAKVMFYWSW